MSLNNKMSNTFRLNIITYYLRYIYLGGSEMSKGPKIYGNTFLNCGTGIQTRGLIDGQIYGNRMNNVDVGIDIDEVFEGEIAHNHIQNAKKEAIRVSQYSPYDYFGIPKNVDLNELRNLFEKLDTSPAEKRVEILEESALSKIDQFTSITERVVNFSKEYGPILLATFGPYFNNMGLS
ncbi:MULTISPECIES: right-handed parallel beta-helix repeat-containing protein [Acinetobacter]|uniref:right-handed parallel beta-helix repeat-containing protein n=1 Tax=Acinetobacter TaxID=469 RepID=UPI0015D344B4|nr:MULTISPECIES: right-handed parallel beta-helix repeat-containing protein [Acinetobacter]MDM1302013.1 right-handed parallel beta-helix repeat-containing protein [Acinetobacter indicus]